MRQKELVKQFAGNKPIDVEEIAEGSLSARTASYAPNNSKGTHRCFCCGVIYTDHDDKQLRGPALENGLCGMCDITKAFGA